MEKNKEIVEGNKLIAEFMGWEYTKSKNKSATYTNKADRDEQLDESELEYHSSWDWLMPVVEKIKHLASIKGDNYEAQAILLQRIFDNLSTCITEHTWLAVVEFIKWYNKQKTQTT